MTTEGPAAPNFPTEIWDHITSYTEPEDLINISLTSKYLNKIVLRKLYGCIRIRNDDDQTRRLQIKSLLRTLISKPERGEISRSLNLSGWQIGRHPRTHDDSLTNAELSSLLQPPSRLQTTGLGNDLRDCLQTPTTDVEDGHSNDAMTAALLSLLPKLETLFLNMLGDESEEDPSEGSEEDSDEEDNPDFLSDTLSLRVMKSLIQQSAQQPNSGFWRNLTHVTIIGPGFDEQIIALDFSMVSTFLTLPSLQRFHVSGIRDGDPNHAWDCEENSSNVKELSLRECKIGFASLLKLLRACQSLHTFRLGRVCEDCFDYIDCDYSYLGLDVGFLRHPSLQQLTIRSDDCEHANQVENGLIDFLPELDSLKELEIDQDAIYTVDYTLIELLPASLEQVHFRTHSDFAEPRYLGEIDELFRTNANLQTFHIMKRIGILDNAEDEWETILRGGHMAGVVFEFFEGGREVILRR